MKELTAQQEDYLLEEAEELNYCKKNNLCIFCFGKLDDYDTENSHRECE